MLLRKSSNFLFLFLFFTIECNKQLDLSEVKNMTIYDKKNMVEIKIQDINVISFINKTIKSRKANPSIFKSNYILNVYLKDSIIPISLKDNYIKIYGSTYIVNHNIEHYLDSLIRNNHTWRKQ